MNKNTSIRLILLALFGLSAVVLFGRASTIEVGWAEENGAVKSKTTQLARKTWAREIFGYARCSATSAAFKSIKRYKRTSANKTDRAGKLAVVLLVSAFLLSFWGGFLLPSTLLLNMVPVLLLSHY